MNTEAMIQSLRRDIALQVSRAARRSGDTQMVAARRLGIPQPTLSKIINGRVSDLSIEFLLRIALRAGLALTLQTGRDADEAGAFVSGLARANAQSPGSRLAQAARGSLMESARRFTPTERLEAFVEHNGLLGALHEAGRAAEQRPGQSALLFLDVIELLNQEHVDYLVVGAFALPVHGTVRASVDVAALLHLSYARLKELSALFAAAQFGVTLNRGDDDDPISSMLILSDAHGNRVDLLGGLRHLDPQIFTRALEVPFRGITLRVVGREDFIAMKCFAGQPQDLIDARAAFEGVQGPLDLDLLRTVTRRLGRDAADRLENILGSLH